MLRKSEALALCRGEHGDPFAVLGMHTDGKGRLWLRTMQPGASAVFVVETESGKEVLELAQRKLDAIDGDEGPSVGALVRRRRPVG